MKIEHDTTGVPYPRARHQTASSMSDSEPIQKKPRQDDVAETQFEQQDSADTGHGDVRQKKTTFKALGNLVLAMKRFQGAHFQPV